MSKYVTIYLEFKSSGLERDECMVHRFLKNAKSRLGKLFDGLHPFSSRRFYPPPFILRNPILKGVTGAIHSGNEVAVLIFNLQNINELAISLGVREHSQLMKTIKKYFRLAVFNELEQRDIISLHDFYGDGLTLFIQINYERQWTFDINFITKNIVQFVENKVYQLYPKVELCLNTGYMFVDKDHYSIHDSIVKAHRQAIAITEKSLGIDGQNLVQLMNRLLIKKEVILLAQPIIDVATNEVRALEILARGPKDSPLESPMQLFSVARQTGKLYELEMMVIEKALEQLKQSKWRQDIFLNCTPMTLSNIRFTNDLKIILDKFIGISPSKITIEVTENESIEGLKYFIYNIKRLRLMGFRIAVDDTGAGYSSLQTISEIMPDIIKIDQSVIKNIDKNALKESMLKGLLLVAKEAGSLVVAEGIENEAEASVLARNNVDLAQGYFYARPATLIKGIAT